MMLLAIRLVMSLVHFDLSIVTVKQSFIVGQIQLSSHSCSYFCLILSISCLYGAGNCWLPFSGICSKLVNLLLFNNWADIAKYSVKIIILLLLRSILTAPEQNLNCTNHVVCTFGKNLLHFACPGKLLACSLS